MRRRRQRAHRSRISLPAGVLVLAACQGQTLELGSSSATSVSGSTASGVYGAFPSAQLCTIPPAFAPDAGDGGSDFGDGGSGGASLVPLVGTWTGYIETLPASQVTLVFTQQTDASVTGTLTFGTAAPLPPPTSSTEPYPPDQDQAGNAPFPYPGFSYTAIDVSFDGTRLQFEIVQNELWKLWCTLQTSYAVPNEGGLCSCLPGWNEMGSPTVCDLVDPNTGLEQAVDCSQFYRCEVPGLYCNCTSAGCVVNMSTSPTNRLDLQLAGTTLNGQITGALNVILNQSP